MYFKFIIGLLLLGFAAGISYGQTPVIFLDTAQSTTLSPGGRITIEALIDQVLSPDLLRGYQVTLEVVPRVGAVGSIGLVDPVTLGDNESIFVDVTRPDWVYANATGSIVAGGNALDLLIGGLVFDVLQSVEITTPAYAGTFIFLASVDAEGTFDINILVTPEPPLTTFLRNQLSLTIPFTTSGLTLNVIPQASNDNCTSSLEIFNGLTPFSTDNTTTNGPDHIGSACDVNGSNTITNDIWYDYTATCNGQLTVTTCGTANFDTRVAIYNGCVCPASSLIECNDNAAGCGLTSEVVNNVFAGNCYKIRVGGTLGAVGSGDITVSCIANDACADAESVTLPAVIQGATINASLDAGLPACGSAIDSPGVWYTVTGTGDLLSASLCGGASYNSRISVFEGSCGNFTCVADANDTCGNRESVSWCSTNGARYFILVHGVGGEEGTFSLNVGSISCDDNNACTGNGPGLTDQCNIDTCENSINYDNTTICCTPADRSLTLIDDNNPCTNGSCNVFTGVVTQTPAPDGPEPACDDSLLCTLDECISGSCANTDINTLTCTNNAGCPGEIICDTGAGFCDCIPSATMELSADPSTLPVTTCYQAGDILTVRVNMGPAAVPIIGAQFFLEYDQVSLQFNSILPGNVIDATSPFSNTFFVDDDPISGTIDYGVTVGFAPGATEATTLAFVRFSVIAGCQPFVRFQIRTPLELPHRFTDSVGGEIIPDNLIDLPPISTDVQAPVLTGCPGNILISPDPGEFFAVVTWPAPIATDSCDTTVPVVCNPPSGFAFGLGTTPVTCSAENSCGLDDVCTFNVSVVGSFLTAVVELSPSVNFGPIDRCITFELSECASGLRVSFGQDMTFTGGLASQRFPIPGGMWDCVTARDSLHTLRSTAIDFSTLDGVEYVGTFVGERVVGDPGGHWLIGGNLNDDIFIDILDFGIFMSLFLTPAQPDTPCGTPSPEANVNGDNVVDLIDFVFVQVNSLMISEPNCCGTGASSAQPLSEVSIRKLRHMGLYHLRYADLNDDGYINAEDMIAFLNGDRPSIIKSISENKTSRHNPRR